MYLLHYFYLIVAIHPHNIQADRHTEGALCIYVHTEALFPGNLALNKFCNKVFCLNTIVDSMNPSLQEGFH